MKKIKVIYKIVSKDGWAMGNRPKVLRVEGINCQITPEEKQKAINAALHPVGGIDWSQWNTGQKDYTIATIF